MAILVPTRKQQPVQNNSTSKTNQNTIRLPMREQDASTILPILNLFERRNDVMSMRLGKLVHLTRTTVHNNDQTHEQIHVTISHFGSASYLEKLLERLSHIYFDSLTISCWPWATNLAVVFAQPHCRIRHLHLEKCPALDDQKFQGLCDALLSYPHLESLFLRLRMARAKRSRQQAVDDECTRITTICPKSCLKRLKIMFYGDASPLVTGYLLQSVLSQQRQLQELELIGSNLSTPLPERQLFAFTNCRESLQNSLAHHTSLKELTLENWRNPLLHAMVEGLGNNHSLDTLDMRHCHKLAPHHSKMQLSTDFDLQSSGLLNHAGQLPVRRLLLPDSIDWTDQKLYGALKDNKSVVDMGIPSTSEGLWKNSRSAIPSILARNAHHVLPQFMWPKWMERHHDSPTALMAFLQSAEASSFVASNN